MEYRNNNIRRKRENHPQISFGLFFIVLGLALLIATNDMLDMGSVREYFTWETVLIFIGVLLLLNLQFTPGLLLSAAGVWFFMDNYYGDIPEIIRTVYWPGVIILLGVSYIISSFFRKKN